jgi:MFS family permease
MLFPVAFLNYLDRQMLSVMRPAMMGDIEALRSAETFGNLMAVFLWIYAFMSPVSGLIADRLNRKWLIVFSLFIWSAVTLAMGFAADYNQLYWLRALMGVSEAFCIPAGLSLIADYHEGKTRSAAIGIQVSGIYLGQVFGGIGAPMAASYSWQHVFWFFGGLGCLYSFVLVAFLRERKAAAPAGAATGRPGIRAGLVSMGSGVSALLGNFAFWAILFYFTAPSAPGWAVKNWLPELVSGTLGVPMKEISMWVTGVTAGCSFLGVLAGGFVSDRWVQRTLRGRVFTGAVGLALMIPALAVIGLERESLPVLLFGAGLFGFGFGLIDVNFMPVLCQFAPPRLRATGYGIMNFVGISCGAVTTSYLGKAAASGRINTVFVALAALIVVALVIHLTCLRPKTANMTEG